MEIRANYILVGAFTLLVLLAAGVFILWIAGQDKNIQMSQYDILVKESVKGLSVNNDVLFTGIKVGKVTDIKISRVTPGEVRVRISIAADTPVRQDSVAQLDVRGITGLAVLSITGGTANSPLILIPEDGVGRIRYEPSTLSSVVAQMPDVLASASQILSRMEKVFSDENTQAVTDILASLSKVSTTLADRAGSIDTILLEADKASGGLSALVAQANQMLATDVKNTSLAVTRITSRVDAALSVMEPGMKQFSTQGLSDMRMLMVEMRNLVHVFTRIGQKVESDPRRFFFGDTVKEYQPR